MSDNAYWLRALVRALSYNIGCYRSEVQALVETLSEADPEFRTKYESRLLEKSRSAQMAATDDKPLLDKNLLENPDLLRKKFEEESEQS